MNHSYCLSPHEIIIGDNFSLANNVLYAHCSHPGVLGPKSVPLEVSGGPTILLLLQNKKGLSLEFLLYVFHHTRVQLLHTWH